MFVVNIFQQNMFKFVQVTDEWDLERPNRSSPPQKRQPYQEPENNLPPYRPPPPPEKSSEEVPTKVMSLQERMSKFQQKVTSTPKVR